MFSVELVQDFLKADAGACKLYTGEGALTFEFNEDPLIFHHFCLRMNSADVSF